MTTPLADAPHRRPADRDAAALPTPASERAIDRLAAWRQHAEYTARRHNLHKEPAGLQLRADMQTLLTAAEQLVAWWETKRPTGWTLAQHQRTPTVNTTTYAEAQLAVQAARLAT